MSVIARRGLLAAAGAGSGALVASGGAVSEPGDGYRYHTFTADGVFEVTAGGSVDIMCIGGGAGGDGGVGGQYYGGGGAAGTYRELLEASLAEGSYAVTVGAGGTGHPDGLAGSSSSFGALLTATGGLFNDNADGKGGDNDDFVGHARSGLTGGGGAGSAENAPSASTGGAGVMCLDGVQRGGGGGGGHVGSGGAGGGGAGSDAGATQHGAANTGSGGGGGKSGGGAGNGGSGIVIVRYPI